MTTALLIPGVDTQPNFQYSFIDNFMNDIAVVAQVEGDNIHHPPTTLRGTSL